MNAVEQKLAEIQEHLTGVVYFAHSHDPEYGGLVKIGYTMNLRQRMRKLGCTPIAVVSGGPDLERYLHGVFGDLRVDGEWFALTDELDEFLAIVRDEKIGEQVPWLD